MSLNRTNSLLAAWTLVFLAAVPALGQGLENAQPFALAEMSTYGGGYRPNEGFFFSFDQLLWWVDKPDKALIGDATTRRVVVWPQVFDDVDGDLVPDPGWEPDKVVEFSTHDTGLFKTKEVGGQRYEFGYLHEHHGWLCDIFQLGDQNQKMYASDVHVVFQDSPFGSSPQKHLQGYIDAGLTLIDDLSVTFDEVVVRYKVQTWGVEMNYLYRAHPFHGGGIFELYLGARYMELDDDFQVFGAEFLIDDDDPANGLGDSFWITRAENHVVGPQLGGRWFRRCGRWTWSTEGRFFAGFNSQNVSLVGGLGSNLDPLNAALLEIRNMRPTEFNHTRHFNEWSPAAELRVDLKYQLTQRVAVRAGWTGFWIDGLTRAPSMIDYSLAQNATMGITDDNRQDLFMHGLSLGIELNR